MLRIDCSIVIIWLIFLVVMFSVGMKCSRFGCVVFSSRLLGCMLCVFLMICGLMFLFSSSVCSRFLLCFFLKLCFFDSLSSLCFRYLLCVCMFLRKLGVMSCEIIE